MQTAVSKVRIFLEMIKVEHSLFVLPFAYLGLLLGRRALPDLPTFFWVTVAMVSFRTMAMGANRLIDCRIDSLNPRTQNRALPAGLLKAPFVWGMTLFSLILFEASAFRLGRLCFLFSPVPVALAWFYPWTKRFTWFSHFVLGMILGIAPYGAWLAGRRSFSWIPGFLMLGVAAWVAGFDMIYALQDVAFDREHDLFSFPARFGAETTLRITRLLHGVTVLSWIAAGWLAGCGPIYFTGLGLVAFFLAREHWLIRVFGLKKLEEAFFKMNVLVSISLFAVTLADSSWGRHLS